MITRPFEASDRPQWDTLWRGYQNHFKGEVPDDVSERTWCAILKADELHGLCAEEDGNIQGFVHYSFTAFAWTASPVCFLQDLYVDAQGRGRGAGRRLIKSVYEAADRKGAANVFWFADAGDERLRRFYGSLATETRFIRFLRHPWRW